MLGFTIKDEKKDRCIRRRLDFGNSARISIAEKLPNLHSHAKKKWNSINVLTYAFSRSAPVSTIQVYSLAVLSFNPATRFQ